MGKARRILLKLSGEYLGGSKGQGFDFEVINSLVHKVADCQEQGFQIGIVLGGGNFFRGAHKLPIPFDRVTGDQIGMLATLMNALCLKEALSNLGPKVSVMAGLQVPAAALAFSKPEAVRRLEAGEILIFGGGTGNPFFSTDTAAVLRALEIGADLVIKGTKVDGVYDKDPVKHADAKKFGKLTFSQALGQDLKVFDGAAMALCRDNNLPLGVLDIDQPDHLARFLAGETHVGTLVSNS